MRPSLLALVALLPCALATAGERPMPSLEREWAPVGLRDDSWAGAPSPRVRLRLADAGLAGDLDASDAPGSPRGLRAAPSSRDRRHSVRLKLDDAARPALRLGKPYGWRDFWHGVGTDQRDFWSWPTQATRHDMRVVLPVVGVLGATFALDYPTAHAVNRSFSKSDIQLSRDVADLADNAFSFGLPLVMWGIGRATHHPRMAETGGLMTQALLSSGIEVKVLKGITGRMRPFKEESGEFTGPGGGFFNRNSSRGDSFPSGHTVSAFAVATVLAGRTDHKWVKWAAFGTAGMIAAARVTGENHFPADVFAGATLGWAQGRLTLRNRRLQMQRERLLSEARGLAAPPAAP